MPDNRQPNTKYLIPKQLSNGGKIIKSILLADINS